MRRFRSFSLAACLALCACGGGGGGSSGSSAAFCDSITGGAATVTSSCVGCSVADEAAAADGNLFTSAYAVVNPATTTVAVSVRATAQDGIVYPAGSDAGVFFTPQGGVCEGCAVTINTYLDGELQETHSGLNNTFVEGRGSPAAVYSAVQTTKPFDAVEIADSGATTPNSGPYLEVYEICSHGGVRD